jgi:hypothetical protein
MGRIYGAGMEVTVAGDRGVWNMTENLREKGIQRALDHDRIRGDQFILQL